MIQVWIPLGQKIVKAGRYKAAHISVCEWFECWAWPM